MDIQKINPFSLVCIEVTGNPGEIVSKSLIQENQTTFDYFRKKAEELGFNISEFVDKLGGKLERA